MAPLLEKKGEKNGKWLRDRLIACGPRAIQPTIRAIAERSPWVRNYAYLPQVLRHFGEPAKAELINAIDEERDLNRRAHLISSLQSGFGYFSRLEILLIDATNNPSRMALRFTATEIRRAFPEAPDLALPGGINPDFAVWWSTNKNRPR